MSAKTKKSETGGQCIRCGKKPAGSQSRFMNGQGVVCFTCLSKDSNPCLLCFEEIPASESRKLVYDIIPAELLKPKAILAAKNLGLQFLTGRLDSVVQVLKRSYHLHEIRELVYDKPVCGFCGVPLAEDRNDVRALHEGNTLQQNQANAMAKEKVGRTICADCYQNNFEKFRSQLEKATFPLDSMCRALVEEWNELRPSDNKPDTSQVAIAAQETPMVQETVLAEEPGKAEAATMEDQLAAGISTGSTKFISANKSGDIRKKGDTTSDLLEWISSKDDRNPVLNLWEIMATGKRFHVKVVASDNSRRFRAFLKKMWRAIKLFFKRLFRPDKNGGSVAPPEPDNTGNLLFQRLHPNTLSFELDKIGQPIITLLFPAKLPMRFLYEATVSVLGFLCSTDFFQLGRLFTLSELEPFDYSEKSLEDNEYLIALATRALALRVSARVLNRYFRDDTKAYLDEIRVQYPILGRLAVYVASVESGKQGETFEKLLQADAIRAWMRPQLEIWKLEDFKTVIWTTKDSGS